MVLEAHIISPMCVMVLSPPSHVMTTPPLECRCNVGHTRTLLVDAVSVEGVNPPEPVNVQRYGWRWLRRHTLKVALCRQNRRTA
jgi:hypothetical protein